MAAVPSVAVALLARLGARVLSAEESFAPSPSLPSGWPELDALLPDGGLPMGVVELSAPRALGGGTSVALAAVRAAQQKPGAFAAWVDPEGSLYGPGVASAGVDLGRLVVVRPPRAKLARFALKVAQSRAFDVVVIDMDSLPCSEREIGSSEKKRNEEGPFDARVPQRKRRGMAPEVLVRKLALAAEEGGATVVLLSNSDMPKAMPWPVALRLELHREDALNLACRVAKERRGRIGLVKTIPFVLRSSLDKRLVG